MSILARTCMLLSLTSSSTYPEVWKIQSSLFIPLCSTLLIHYFCSHPLYFVTHQLYFHFLILNSLSLELCLLILSPNSSYLPPHCCCLQPCYLYPLHCLKIHSLSFSTHSPNFYVLLSLCFLFHLLDSHDHSRYCWPNRKLCLIDHLLCLKLHIQYFNHQRFSFSIQLFNFYVLLQYYHHQLPCSHDLPPYY